MLSLSLVAMRIFCQILACNNIITRRGVPKRIVSSEEGPVNDLFSLLNIE